jgi:hypothetical protein
MGLRDFNLQSNSRGYRVCASSREPVPSSLFDMPVWWLAIEDRLFDPEKGLYVANC